MIIFALSRHMNYNVKCKNKYSNLKPRFDFSVILIKYQINVLEATIAAGTWTSADIAPATYAVFGGDHFGLNPGANLKTRHGLWHSDFTHGPRGVSVTFNTDVTITRFSGPYLTLQ